jgi:four helix bundle protein
MDTQNNTKGYEKLIVWKEAHAFVLMIYKATRSFPKEELFGITSQLRRAAVSVPANIIEGQARASRKEFVQFLYIANGSLVESEYYISLVRDLRYITDETFNALEKQCRSVGILLHRFIFSLKR